jgi:hypothetical protein
LITAQILHVHHLSCACKYLYCVYGNIGKRVSSIRLDTLLVGRDANPTTFCSSVSQKNHLFLSTRSYRSYSIRSPATSEHRTWALPCQARRAGASEMRHSAAGPTRHDALGARLSALPGAACGCPLPVMRPLSPSRVARPMAPFRLQLMSPFRVVQSLLPPSAAGPLPPVNSTR